MRPILFFDTEVYRNWYYTAFRCLETGEVRGYEFPYLPGEADAIRELISRHRLVSFNGTHFDLPLLLYSLTDHATLETLKLAATAVIVHNVKQWTFAEQYGINPKSEEIDHVDIIEVAPLTASLKAYAARLHAVSIQDLPLHPDALVTPEMIPVIREYCLNDVLNTEILYKALAPQLELREAMSAQYGIDLRSKSDAQIAEAVIKKEVETKGRDRHVKVRRPDDSVRNDFQYRVPAWMDFHSHDLQVLLEKVRGATFKVSEKGGVLMPESIKTGKNTIVWIAGKEYRMGTGGLHSCESNQVIEADEEYGIEDVDVTGYYPNLILTQGLYPAHIGKDFLDVYKSIVDRRTDAKRTGNKVVADSLKIVANSTYGKFGSRWSVLYSPELVIRVTVTGQLALLMLIERLSEIEGVTVTSANTDGVTYRYPRASYDAARAVVKEWETYSGLSMESVSYQSVYSRDVSNYVAVQVDGKVKLKGDYNYVDRLDKNPDAQICARAAVDYLTLGASIETTIELCDDIRQFVCVRKVTGGAVFGGKDIGKVVRWYYTLNSDDSMRYKVNEHQVPDTLGARICVVLPDHTPVDVDRGWYVARAREMVRDLGVAI